MRVRASYSLLIPLLLAGCADDHPTALEPAAAGQALAAAAGPFDISGTWSDVVEHTSLVVKPADAVLHLSCVSTGEMQITQNGSTFTGTLHHSTSACVLRDGSPFPPPWSTPYDATFSGTIAGHALHIDQYDAPPAFPTHCPKNGRILLDGGAAVQLTTVGKCDLGHLPFPAQASNRMTANR